MANRSGKEWLNVRHRAKNVEFEEEAAFITSESFGGRRHRQSKVNVNLLMVPLLYPIIIFLVLFQIIIYMDGRLPTPVLLSDIANKEESLFCAERAMGHLRLLSGIGPRVAGSFENEVLAVDFLLREIKWATSALSARDKDRVLISTQKADGWYFLAFKPNGMLNSYEGLQNIVVKIMSKSKSPDSLLINCHFDSVPTSPGASDDAVHCAIMLELLRVFSEVNAPEFSHNLIFLFNGAEENPLQTAHAFISQHEWAKEVRAFINLEAAGAGSKEILFQTGPGNSWLVKAYAESVPHPNGNAMGEEIFQSGLVPSDTDFRVFRDFGKIPGLDFAYARNGYVYHTKYDDISRIPLGTIQHTGENLLALIPRILSSPEFSSTGMSNDTKLSPESLNDRAIYYDIIGLFMFSYSESLGKVINLFTVLLSVILIFGRRFGSYSGSHERRGWKILWSSGMALAGWIIGAMMAIGTAVVLDYFGHPLTWFSRPSLIFPLFFCPTLAGCLFPHILFSPSQPSSLAQKFKVQILSSLICITVKTWIIMRQIFSLASVILIFYYILLAFSLFVPISARIGAKLNPDLLIGVLATLLCVLVFSHVVPLIHLVSSPRKVALSLIGMHCLAVFAVMLTPIGFPYGSKPSDPTPQRAQVLHVRSRVHFDTSSDLQERSLFWMVDLDRNGAHFSLPKAVEKGCQLVSPESCQEILFCGIPVYTSRFIDLLPYTHVVPAPEPAIHQPSDLKLISQKAMSTTVRRLTFNISGNAYLL
ncbi:hypothetical protein J437_LFUL003064 [Ladona fulva]|uniref:FXNA-like protease n=1 Tax=Ladona fulva TaxID=123851 RepID=A0A8K0NU12_LADFU|nr:hypothetical protein J437_LFUL003064 [Ladona fulva]